MVMNDIGIVIVNYNVRHFLVQCLQSIRNSHTRGLKLEVWVVDNASVDGSSGLLSKDFPEVKLIVNKENRGFSAANNQAISQLNSRYVLLLNPDTVLEEDTLRKCYDFMCDHREAGALGVRMIDGSGKFLPESKRKIPDLWNSFCKLSFLSEIFPRSRWFSGYNLGYLSEFETHEIEILCGAFMFMPAEVLNKTGLLDEAFFMYGEDIDLSFRILKAGYKIYYYPETSIIHYKGESTKKSSLNYVKTFYGAMLIYVNKHYGQGNAKLFARLIRVAILFRALLSSIFRLVKIWGLPLTDILITISLMHLIKLWWAAYYFHDTDYYQTTNITVILGIYTLIWVFFLWIAGHYDRKSNWINTISGIGTGTFCILITYALLPEYMRTSRALILLGTMVSLGITLTTRFLWRSVNKSADESEAPLNIAIVALKPNAEKLLYLVKNVKSKVENIHIISPRPMDNDPYFSNNINDLPEVVKSLKIDEIIYSSEDMTMKDIIHSMTTMERQVSFKIGGDDSLSIIGSNHKNQQGELYSLDVSYRLANAESGRFKRLFDLGASVLIIPLLPFLWLLNGFNTGIFKNLITTLFGTTTWVGYGGDLSDYSFLPKIRQGIISYPLAFKKVKYAEDYFKKMNILYAKEYTVFTDATVLMHNLYRLSKRSRSVR